MVENEIAQAFVEDMGVDLGGGDIGMAKQCLDCAQIGTVGQKMGGEGVAQGVGRHLGGGDTACDGEFLDQRIEAMAGQVAGFAM